MEANFSLDTVHDLQSIKHAFSIESSIEDLSKLDELLMIRQNKST